MDNQAERVVKALEGIKKAIYVLAGLMVLFIPIIIMMMMYLFITWIPH